MLAPIVVWGFYLVLRVLGGVARTELFLPALGVGVTVVGLAVLAWRVRLFTSIYSDGLEASATISSVAFYRDRGRVEYTYTYQGTSYSSGNAIHKLKRTEALRVGEQVVVLVDRNKPERAYIRNLYV